MKLLKEILLVVSIGLALSGCIYWAAVFYALHSTPKQQETSTDEYYNLTGGTNDVWIVSGSERIVGQWDGTNTVWTTNTIKEDKR